MQHPLPNNNNYVPQPSFNTNYMQQSIQNPDEITYLITAMNMALVLMAKAFKLNYSTPTNNNQRISSNPRNKHIAQPGMNMVQDRQMQMVGGNGENQFRQFAGQNVRNQIRYNAGQIAGNQNGYNAMQNTGNHVIHNAVQNPGDIEEIEEVNANCILMANLQQTYSSGTQADKAPVYDSDGSAENDSNVIPADSNMEHS
ncbi:hypothetical protein Tco_0553875 [Tanacetum coccineum]